MAINNFRHTSQRDFSRIYNPPHGFTLIELLVVISIVTLLIAILLPALGNARQAARQMICLSNHRSVNLALIMYRGDNDGYFPFRSDQRFDTPDGLDNWRWYYALAYYLGSQPRREVLIENDTWFCPAMDDAPGDWAAAGSPGGMYGPNTNLMPIMQADGTTLNPYHYWPLADQYINEREVEFPSQLITTFDQMRPLAWAQHTSLNIHANTQAMAPHFTPQRPYNTLSNPFGSGAMVAGFVDGHAESLREDDFNYETSWNSYRIIGP